MKKRRLTLHGLVALLLGVAVLIIYLIGRRARLPYAGEMEARPSPRR